MNFNYESLISESCKNIPRSFIREILEVAEQPDFISFAGGLPNPAYFPLEQMNKAFRKVMENDGREALQYSGSQGFFPLREFICKRYNSLYNTQMRPQNIIITNGSQQALDILGKLFINPEDPLILEKPSYLGAIQAFSAYLPNFHQVNLTENGIDLNELEDVITKTNARILYGIPNFQNPSGISYSEETRKELAILLEWHGIIFIEDDPYNEIRFEGTPLPPVFSHLPEQVIWCGSFSKMIAPGIRTGWMCAPDELIPKLLRIKQASDLQSNNLIQRVIFQFLNDNEPEEHLQKVKSAYKKQKDTMIKAIHEFFPESSGHTNPEGGMFIWLTLPDGFNTEKVIEKSLQEKVAFVPGRSFFTTEGGTRNMRLNFSNASEEMIMEGMKRLGETIKEFAPKKL
ncbi:MAG: PLP-dependent aminotransferase family protein [Prolixibacteraceae bacterium]|jgi:2-aminoadipate transaminase|nr:PLP-dependent aminotransferase family protein [Prolixibacteraceae bacterium]